MYYVFDKDGRCVCSSMASIDYGDEYVELESDNIYEIGLIKLENGEITHVQLEQPPLVVEDEYVIDERSVDILSAIAELSEAILELQGGNNL